MKNTVILMVLDGWGIGEENQSNPIFTVKPKTIEYIKNNFPSGALQASGIAVGLPWGEEGNSEVGHLTLGAGKVIYQHFPRISLSIKEGTFFSNKVINDAFLHAQKNNSKINLVGLIGQANVHSSLEHLETLIEIARKQNIKYALHLFTDGRDSEPNSAMALLSKMPQDKIATISGRYYAMDRDKRWELTQKVYDVMTGKGRVIQMQDLEAHIKKTYDKKLNDEFVDPVIIGDEKNCIQNGDSVFFFNFREDRMRQIGESFVNPYFSQFPVKNYKEVSCYSMTKIKEDFDIPIAFPPQVVENPLGKIISENGKSQLRIAETQKYAHVTFFFNGLKDTPFNNEYRILVPSKIIPHQETDPIMMAPAITGRLVEAIEEKAFDFILVNYANPDIIAHTGNLEASCKAVEIINEELAKVVDAVFKNDATLLITSDHGNVERLYNMLTGEPETKHDASPVPIYLVGKKYHKNISQNEAKEREKFTIGMLSDVAPTIIELMGIPKPPDMEGGSLLRSLLW